MRKFRLIFALIFALLIALVPTSNALAWELDQSYSSGSIANVNIGPRAFCGQTFVPTLPTLDWIEIYAGQGGDNWLSGELVRVSTGETVATGGTRIADDWAWYSIIGSGTLVPGEAYQIKATTSSDIYWKVGSNGYASGQAYYPSANPDRDFWFKTYGTPAEDPGGDSDGDSDSDGDGDSDGDSALDTSSQGQAPSTNVDYSMDIPDELKAEDISKSDDAKAKLSWQASESEDIDGYRVFNKTDPDDEFGMVVEVDKDTTEIDDSDVEFDTDYIYMVRAYKDDAESDSSNEATVTPKKSKIKVFPALVFGKDLWKHWEFWLIVLLVLAIIGFIIWFLIDRKKRKKKEEEIKSA